MQRRLEYGPFDLEYENMGAGWANDACTLPPVPIGPAVALIPPPIVTLPPRENARTASSLFSTITKSVISAPIWSPQPNPPVAMQDGADQDPSGRRAMTRPDPAFPENTKPAFRTWKTARPGLKNSSSSNLKNNGNLCRYLGPAVEQLWG